MTEETIVTSLRREYSAPPPEAAEQNKEWFKNFVRMTCDRYRGDDGPDGQRERGFLVAMKYLKDLDPVLYGNGFYCNDDKCHYAVIYNMNASLYIERHGSGENAQGFVRNLQEMVRDVCGAGKATGDPKSCTTCGEKHMIYGLELEIMALYGDNRRNELLSILNNTAPKYLDNHQDDYGVDGSGRPLELRNINGDTATSVCKNLSDRLVRFFTSLESVKARSGLGIGPMSTSGCGIHVHFFHKGVSRGKVLAAHSVVGMMMNQCEPVIWQGRAASGYGLLFGHRRVAGDGNQWCSDDAYATELRMFNCFHPSVLKFALDQTEALLGSPVRAFEAPLKAAMRVDPNWTPSMVTAQAFNRVLAWMIKHGGVEQGFLDTCQAWLKENYLTVFGEGAPSKPLYSEPAIALALKAMATPPPAIVQPNLFSPPHIGLDVEAPAYPGDRVRLSINATAEELRSYAENSETVRRMMTTAPNSWIQRMQGLNQAQDLVGSYREQQQAAAQQSRPYASWCDRVRTARSNSGSMGRVHTTRAGFSLRRHVLGCVECARMITDAGSEGFRINVIDGDPWSEIGFLAMIPIPPADPTDTDHY